MPTKRLPQSADIDHLKSQAKDLLRAFRAGEMQALQRVREFHPQLRGLSDASLADRRFTLGDALLSIAREYGYRSWPRLRSVVAKAGDRAPDLIHNDRIKDAAFRKALDFLDEGNAAGLAAQLEAHPGLVHRIVEFEGDNYFSAPTLLEFVAENPIRQGALPANIVTITQIILDAGAKENAAALDAAATLVASGRVARECGVQGPLLDLLCDHGADPAKALPAAVAHGEFDAVEKLIARGARPDLPTLAALDRRADIRAMLEAASDDQLQRALALAALHGRAGVIELLLRAGADPNRYNPPGSHAHCTPLHSAAFAGHFEAVRVLVENGARVDIDDIHWSGTAIDWARHAGHDKIADFLTQRP